MEGSCTTATPSEKTVAEEDPFKKIFDTTTQEEILEIISTKAATSPNLDEFIEITNFISAKEFERIKNYILEKGDRRTYRNYDNDNPHYHLNDFNVYLNSEIGQRNINNDPVISGFNEITIRDLNHFDLQYCTFKIVRRGDIEMS